MERFPMDAETWAQVNTHAAGYLPMVKRPPKATR